MKFLLVLSSVALLGSVAAPVALAADEPFISTHPNPIVSIDIRFDAEVAAPNLGGLDLSPVALAASTTLPSVVSTAVSMVTTTKVVLPNIPSAVDVEALRTYWLGQINALRKARDLRLLVLDERFNATATEWATYMGKLGSATHVRKGGASMQAWINRKDEIEFTKRNSLEGWKSNYFTENIAWGYVDGSTASATSSLKGTLKFFLGEAKSNGPHYRTIYHKDWNSVGLGFYFRPIGKGKYQLYTAMHYGSLAPQAEAGLEGAGAASNVAR